MSNSDLNWPFLRHFVKNFDTRGNMSCGLLIDIKILDFGLYLAVVTTSFHCSNLKLEKLPMTLRRTAALWCLLSIAVTGCKSSDFTGSTETKKPLDSPKPTPVPGKPTTPDEPVAPGNFGLGKIQDRSVNTGDRSVGYSEELTVPLNPQGGTPPYTLSYSMSPANTRPLISSSALVWKPGFTDATGYHTEEGTYSVTVTAKDSAGKSSSSTFNINVIPITWSSAVVTGADKDLMDVEFTINEKLHPSRRYSHSPVVSSQNLNSVTCRNMANPTTSFQMPSAPSVTSNGSSPAGSGATHKMKLSMRYPLASQPLDNMMFVARLNFMAQDDGKNVQTDETGIFITYAYARCRNTSLSDQDCKRSILQSGGKSAVYYCSDYVGSNSMSQTMQTVFCGTAKLNGVAVPGC